MQSAISLADHEAYGCTECGSTDYYVWLFNDSLEYCNCRQCSSITVVSLREDRFLLSPFKDDAGYDSYIVVIRHKFVPMLKPMYSGVEIQLTN